jgi:hypothetical protein
VLQGPGYRAERLVQVRFGAAAAIVTLPAVLSPGTWSLAMEDLSGIRSQAHHQVGGQMVIDIGLFSVKD